LHHAMMRSIAWPLSIGSWNLTKQLREKIAKACSWAPSQKQRVTNDAETE
jgi:hypothetical protein